MENLNRIKLLCFGKAREIVLYKQIDMTIPSGITVGELRTHLLEIYPALNGQLAYAVAVNQNYAQNDEVIPSNAEVAIIPPVSGG